MDATLWNVGSIFLALAAWIFPVAGLFRSLKRKDSGELLWAVASFAVCGVSLCMQLYYQEHLVAIRDWSALSDTAHHGSSSASTLPRWLRITVSSGTWANAS